MSETFTTPYVTFTDPDPELQRFREGLESGDIDIQFDIKFNPIEAFIDKDGKEIKLVESNILFKEDKMIISKTCNCCEQHLIRCFNCFVCGKDICTSCSMDIQLQHIACIKCLAKAGHELQEPFKTRLENIYRLDSIKYKESLQSFEK